MILEIKFDDRVVMRIYTVCLMVTGIKTLIGSLIRCKEARYLINVFKHHVLLVNVAITSIISCYHGLALLQHKSFFFTNFSFLLF